MLANLFGHSEGLVLIFSEFNISTMKHQSGTIFVKSAFPKCMLSVCMADVSYS